MFRYPELYQFSPLYIAQAAFTIWMLIDASRRGVEYYWFWIILFFQPLGAWAYFFVYRIRNFDGGLGWLTNLFQRKASVQELRHRAKALPTTANRLELAERLVQTGAYDEAQPHLEATLAHEPEHCLALFLLAQCYRGQRHPEQAVPPLQKLVARQPAWEDYEGWHMLIEVCREAGNLSGAVEHSREIARMAPCLEHQCMLAENLFRSGEKAEARQILERGLQEYRHLVSSSRRRDRHWFRNAKELLKDIG
jgi:hypothetical protein